MIHPGPWLNTTTESEAADMAPIHDLNQIQNRPWALQSLDSDYGKDFSPFVWIFAVQPEALTAQEGVIQHSWNHLLNRWQRFPISHISEANQVTRYDITEFQRLTNKVWKLKAANLARDHHLITRSSTYAQTLHQLRLENPYVEDAELRARTLKTLNFISNHAAASFSQIPAEQRQQILDTFIKWETNRIRAGLTGLDSSLHDALHSDTDDLFLKQFCSGPPIVTPPFSFAETPTARKSSCPITGPLYRQTWSQETRPLPYAQHAWQYTDPLPMPTTKENLY